MKRTLHPTIVAILLVLLLLAQPLAGIVGLIVGLKLNYEIMIGISCWVVLCTVGFVCVLFRNLERKKWGEDPWENFFSWNGLTLPVLFFVIDDLLRQWKKEKELRKEQTA